MIYVCLHIQDRVVCPFPSGKMEGLQKLFIMYKGQIARLKPRLYFFSILIGVIIAPRCTVGVEIADDNAVCSLVPLRYFSPFKWEEWWFVY